MLVIGEKINSSRRKVESALKSKDEEFIITLARKQKEAGADFVDVNCGTLLEEEKECMEWLVELIQANVDVPLSIDSPNPEVVEAGFRKHKGKAFLNSISGEEGRIKPLLPLIKEFRPFIVVLLMDNKGIPPTAEGRLRVALEVTERLEKEGVEIADVFFDPIIKPLSTDEKAGWVALETISLVKKEIPEAKTIVGLSNISFGLPNRSLLNAVYLAMAMGRGLDGAILDPLDSRIKKILLASKSLRGEDSFCMEYITAYREGILED